MGDNMEGRGGGNSGERKDGEEIGHARRQGCDGWKAMVEENEEGKRGGKKRRWVGWLMGRGPTRGSAERKLGEGEWWGKLGKGEWWVESRGAG